MMDKTQQPTALDPSLAPSPSDSKMLAALKVLIEKSRVRVGLMARRARNTLQRMQGAEPEPAGPVHYHGIKKWARYHRRDRHASV